YGDVGAFEACLNPAGTDHFLKWGVSSGWQSPKKRDFCSNRPLQTTISLSRQVINQILPAERVV
ncbi:hypothetical protein, partial [Thiolapillus sp.]|uniref:hypothetical protein n=1 Tax=Thiolapillus sp. TaxID=2017437 RepID=UPI003AF4B3C5